jgi:hypothetical protein
LPPTLQEQIRNEFQREKRQLLAQIEEWKTEKDNSQQAFDKYRERARLSLLKSAADQRELEDKIKGHNDLIQVC